jgi:hypothetical protein
MCLKQAFSANSVTLLSKHSCWDYYNCMFRKLLAPKVCFLGSKKALKLCYGRCVVNFSFFGHSTNSQGKTNNRVIPSKSSSTFPFVYCHTHKS